MSDPIENCTLEISCTVGSIANALEALEDGADINCRSGAPLFNAIYNRNIEIIRMLIEKGADLTLFLSPPQLTPLGGDINKIVEALMACSPPDPDAIELDAMEEFDEEIRAKGIETPVKSGDWDGLVRYARKLEKIGASLAQACIAELIELLKPAKEFGDVALFESVKAEKKKITALSARYCEEAEDIANLTQLYLSNQATGGVAIQETTSQEDSPEEEPLEETSTSSEPEEAIADQSAAESPEPDDSPWTQPETASV